MPPLPSYAFMMCTGTILLYFYYYIQNLDAHFLRGAFLLWQMSLFNAANMLLITRHDLHR
jgi:hypothetical protein